ncbi:hypothetical protein ACWEOZ_07790 [Actinoplanes sp. NPDC004185]
MSDGPRDQESDGYRTADEPTTGPPAGAVSASAFDADTTSETRAVPRATASTGTASGAGSASTYGTASSAGGAGSASGAGSGTGAGSRTGTGGAEPSDSGEDDAPSGASAGRDSRLGSGTRPRARTTRTSSTRPGQPTGSEAETKKRRRRRLFVAGISVAAAVIVIVLCAGGLAVLRAVSGFRDDAADAREDRRLRDSACLELEDRLNRLVPPGATTTPQARAVAVRDENAATRIYVGRLGDQRVSDGWRELLDARTAFAEALDAQVKSRTPAFFVAPAPRDGVSSADQLARWSPAACAGPIRRLAAPDL